MFCKYCGETVPEGARFCKNCGASFENSPKQNEVVYPKSDEDIAIEKALKVANQKPRSLALHPFLIIAPIMIVMLLIWIFSKNEASKTAAMILGFMFLTVGTVTRRLALSELNKSEEAKKFIQDTITRREEEEEKRKNREDIFENRLKNGLTYPEVCEILGFEGELFDTVKVNKYQYAENYTTCSSCGGLSFSGLEEKRCSYCGRLVPVKKIKIGTELEEYYKWSFEPGIICCSFIKGKLTSKSEEDYLKH